MSDAGSSERRTSPTSSARQLAAQAISAPCSASVQTPFGMPGWLRSPGRKRVPVQRRSPDDGTPRPTVGAKCRGLGATYAKGWLIMVGASRTSPVPGSGMRHRHVHWQTLPRFGALRGDNSPSPALRGFRMITKALVVKWCSLSCLLEVEEGRLALSSPRRESSSYRFEPFGWVPWGVYIGLPPRGTIVIRWVVG